MKNLIHTVNQPDSDVTAFFLSCDRLDLLDITISSFLETVSEEVKLVLYDDSGRADIFSTLLEKYGDKFDIICFPEKRGQWVAYDFMTSYVNTKYIFYVEDDWKFIQSGYLQLSRNILESNRLIGNVDISERSFIGYGGVGEETELFIWKRPWRIDEQHLYWIGWQGSPNLKRREDYILLGRIENLTPEWVIDRKFHLMGLMSVAAKTTYVEHIGYGRSRMEGQRPSDNVLPCDTCPLKDACRLPRTDWYYMEKPNNLAQAKIIRPITSEECWSEKMSQIVKHVFKPLTVVHVGCSYGDFVSKLNDLGIKATGLVDQSNLSDALKEHYIGRYDIAICFNANLKDVGLVCGLSDVVIFSSCSNSREYWRGEFNRINFVMDEVSTYRVLNEVLKEDFAELFKDIMVMKRSK